ncbi:MAG: hypothetical protein N2445_08610, partial [Acidobacteria bacterium]|nr:hypothetical protein [Acidobacteriota bacterium]
LYSCPEDLDPAKVMILSKRALFEEGIKPKKEFCEVNPMYHYRRTPTKLLIKRLGLQPYLKHHKYIEKEISLKEVVLKLNQHRGEPAKAVVKKGQKVERYDLVAETEEGRMGSRIFSSISGVVKSVDKEQIVVETK